MTLPSRTDILGAVRHIFGGAPVGTAYEPAATVPASGPSQAELRRRRLLLALAQRGRPLLTEGPSEDEEAGQPPQIVRNIAPEPAPEPEPPAPSLLSRIGQRAEDVSGALLAPYRAAGEAVVRPVWESLAAPVQQVAQEGPLRRLIPPPREPVPIVGQSEYRLGPVTAPAGSPLALLLEQPVFGTAAAELRPAASMARSLIDEGADALSSAARTVARRVPEPVRQLAVGEAGRPAAEPPRFPEQADMFGPPKPTYRPENAPIERQGEMPIEAPRKPVEVSPEQIALPEGIPERPAEGWGTALRQHLLQTLDQAWEGGRVKAEERMNTLAELWQDVQDDIMRTEFEMTARTAQVGAVKKPSAAIKDPLLRRLSRLRNDELANLAEQEGVNPYQADWWEGIDSVAVKDFFEKRRVLPKEQQITGIAARLQSLRDELSDVDRRAMDAVMEYARYLETTPYVPEPERELAAAVRNALGPGGPQQAIPVRGTVGGAEPIPQKGVNRAIASIFRWLTGRQQSLSRGGRPTFGQVIPPGGGPPPLPPGGPVIPGGQTPSNFDPDRFLMDFAEVLSEVRKPSRRLTPGAVVRVTGQGLRRADEMDDVAEAWARMGGNHAQAAGKFVGNLSRGIADSEKLFDLGPDGVVRSGNAAGLSILDLIEQTTAAGMRLLSPQQQDYIRIRREWVNKLTAWANQRIVRAGGKPLAQSGSYFPRFVDAVKGESMRPVRGALGARQSPESERVFQYATDAILQSDVGYANPDRALELYTQVMVKMVADEEAMAWAKGFGGRLRSGQRATALMGQSQLPGLFGVQFPERVVLGRKVMTGREFAQRLNDAFTPKQMDTLSNVLRLLAEPAQLERALQTVFDVATPFIQGFPLMLHSPLKWTRIAGRYYQSLLDPAVKARWIAKHQELAEQFIKGGGVLGQSEFLESAVAKGAQRLPIVGKGLARMQDSFSDYLDLASLSMLETMEDYRYKGASAPTEVADAAMMLTGRRGVFGPLTSQPVAQFERIFGAYAPRFLKAVLALASDAVLKWNDPAGDLARRALLRMGFTFGAMTLAGAAAMDAAKGEWRFSNPDSPDFALNPNGRFWSRFPLLGKRIGISNVYEALMRATAKSIVAVAEGDPERFLSTDPLENPLLGMFSTRLSIPVRTGMTLATRRNFQGEPLETPGEIVGELAKGFLPFGARSVGEEGAVAGLQFFGPQVSEFTPAMRRDDIREQLAGAMLKERDTPLPTYGRRWEALSDVEREQLERSNDTLRTATTEAAERFRRTGRGQTAALSQEAQAAREKRAQSVSDLFEEAWAPEKLPLLRNRIDDIRSEYVRAREAIPDTGGGKEQSEARTALGAYYEQRPAPQESGQEFAERRAVAFAALPDEARKLWELDRTSIVEDLRDQLAPEQLSLVREMLYAEERVRAYWDAGDAVIEVVRNGNPEQAEQLAALKRAYEQLSALDKNSPQAQKLYEPYLNARLAYRKALVRKDREIAHILLRWYDEAPAGIERARVPLLNEKFSAIAIPVPASYGR